MAYALRRVQPNRLGHSGEGFDDGGCAFALDDDRWHHRSGGGVELSALTHDMPVERFRTASGEDLSDHPPVVVEFDWDRAAG